MESPVLCKVPNPTIPVRDITLHTFVDSRDGRTISPAYLLRGSSLKGKRLISEFFYMLDYLVEVVNADEYYLQRLDDDLRPLPGTAIERSSLGTIIAGNYLIQPAVEGGKITLGQIPTFSDYLPGADSLRPVAKRAKRDGGGTIASDKSSRDPSDDDSQSFKMRLVHRDKGCAVCLATGIRKLYEYPDDSNRYEGAHIIDFAYHVLWDSRGYSALVSDPFTDPDNAENPFASPSTRTKKDLRRINSLENGMLLCLLHHKDYDNFRFSVHADTHKISSFHPKTVELQGIEVKVPWESPDVLYPPPHPSFLEMHYFTSIAKAMKGGAGDYELDDDDDDYEELSEELSEPAEVRNEEVKIWLDSSSYGREITSLDVGAENKGHFEMLADMQGVVSV